MLVCSVVELSCISTSAAATGCGSWWWGQRCSVQHVDIVVHVWILHRLLSRMLLLHIDSLLSTESAVHTECRYAVLRSGIEWMLATAAYLNTSLNNIFLNCQYQCHFYSFVYLNVSTACTVLTVLVLNLTCNVSKEPMDHFRSAIRWAKP